MYNRRCSFTIVSKKSLYLKRVAPNSQRLINLWPSLWPSLVAHHIDLKGTEEEETAPNPGSVVESPTSSFADCVVAAFARWVRRTTDRHFSGVFTR